MASSLDGVDPGLVSSIKEDLKDPSKWTGIDPSLVNSIKKDIGFEETPPLNTEYPLSDAALRGFNSQPIPKDSGFLEGQAHGAGSAIYPAAGAVIGEAIAPEATPISGILGAAGGRAVQNLMANLQGYGPQTPTEHALSLSGAAAGQAAAATAGPYIEKAMDYAKPFTDLLSEGASRAGNFIKGGAAKILGGTTGIPTDQMLKFIDNLPEAISNSVRGYAKQYVNAITPEGANAPLMGIKQSIAAKALNASQEIPNLDGEAGEAAIRAHISPIIAKFGGNGMDSEAMAELEAIKQKKLKIDTDMENIVSKRENLSVQQARLNKQITDSQEEINQIRDAIDTARKSKKAGASDVADSLQQRLDAKLELFNATQNKLTQNSNALDTLKTRLEDQARQQSLLESDIMSRSSQMPTRQEALDVIQGVNRLSSGAERDSKVLYGKWAEQATQYLEKNGLPNIRQGLKAYELGKVGDLFRQLMPHVKSQQQAWLRAGVPTMLETAVHSPSTAALSAILQSPALVATGLAGSQAAGFAAKEGANMMAILAPKLLAQEAANAK